MTTNLNLMENHSSDLVRATTSEHNMKHLVSGDKPPDYEVNVWI